MDQNDIEELFYSVVDNPSDAEKQQQLADAFKNDPETVLKGVKSAADRMGLEQHAPDAIMAPGAVPKWENCIEQQVSKPVRWETPGQLKDLVDIVNSAKEKKLPVRAVGSGHSFSSITNTDGAILVDPRTNLNQVLKVDLPTLKTTADPANIFRVQCGIAVKSLNDALDAAGLALINMGAYDGQTVSGALSTGTHGSGAAYGPMASSLLSVVIVSDSGDVYQVEPADGITDPAKFHSRLPESDVPIILKQDDSWFRAVQVAMGCLGIIYSYTLRVCPAFSLSEVRTMTTWEAVKPLLGPEAWNPLPQPLKDINHYELLLNPYAESNGTHSCVKVERTRITPKTTPRGARLSKLGELAEKIGVEHASAIVHLLNFVPWLSVARLSINRALGFLPDYDPPYVDVSHAVFTLGIENTMKAWALELHFDAVDCVATIDKVLKIFNDLATTKSWLIAGPIGVRFIAPSDAFLAPESGRLTCTAELDMLVGINHDRELLEAVKEALCGADSPGGNKSVRVHWGLDWDFTTADDVRKWYPNLGEWQNVYRKMNSTGMFDNSFTKRVNLRG